MQSCLSSLTYKVFILFYLLNIYSENTSAAGTIGWWEAKLRQLSSSDEDSWPGNVSFHVENASGSRIFDGQVQVKSCLAQQTCLSQTRLMDSKGRLDNFDMQRKKYSGGEGGCAEAWVFVANSDALIPGITTWVQSVRMYSSKPRDIVGIVTKGVTTEALDFLINCLKVTVKVAPTPLVQSCPRGSKMGSGHQNCLGNRVKQYTNKLLIVLLDDYCRIVYSDTDIWFWSNPDELFETPSNTAVAAMFPRFSQTSRSIATSIMALRPSRELFLHYLSFIKDKYYQYHAQRAGWDDQGFWNIAYGANVGKGSFARLRNSAVPNAKFARAQEIGRFLHKSKMGILKDYSGTIGVHYNGRTKPWMRGCGGSNTANLGLVKSWRHHLKSFILLNHTSACKRVIQKRFKSLFKYT